MRTGLSIAAIYLGVFVNPGVFAQTPEDAVQNYAQVAFATYSEALQGAIDLQAAIGALVASPDEAALEKAREAWLHSRESYGQTEVFRFYGGPIDGVGPEAGWREGVEGPEGRMNAWPLNEAFIDYVDGNADAGIINDSSLTLSLDALIERNAVTDEADVTTGYHAIEFLLWGQDLSTDGPGARPASDFAGDSEPVSRRKTYLELVTGLLVSDLESLKSAWASDQEGNYRAAFVAQPPVDALGKIMTGMATLSGFELASERLAVPLDSGDQEDEHSCFSDNTHRDFVANAQAIRNVWRGSFGSVDGVGIDELVRKASVELADQIEEVNARTVMLAESIEPPVDRILATPEGDPARDSLQSLVDALYEQAELLVQAGRALGVDVVIAGE